MTGLEDIYCWIFKKKFCKFYTLRVEDIIYSLYLQANKKHRYSRCFIFEIPYAMIWNKTVPKHAIEGCQKMKIGQIVVLCDLSGTWHTVSAPRSSPRANE